ncbi:MAG TPA: hypothetical protein VJR94_05370 [Candidatus Nitrosocosmicus sp.]|nr:hypothetical protein [Candidatus Nitrosocosmicus sp.]
MFSLSPKWSTGLGLIEQHVLADLYAWLEAHSGLSHSAIDTTRHNTTLDTNSNSSVG